VKIQNRVSMQASTAAGHQPIRVELATFSVVKKSLDEDETEIIYLLGNRCSIRQCTTTSRDKYEAQVIF
jgi:hypothetical protein